MPISGKEMRKLFYQKGYELVPGAGNGSHWKLKKKGKKTVVIPDHKELSKGSHSLIEKYSNLPNTIHHGQIDLYF